MDATQTSPLHIHRCLEVMKEKLDFNTKFIKYSQSSQVVAMGESSVSYAAGVVSSYRK